MPETILHPQQLGGRKGVSVALGGHLIRAFLRIFAARTMGRREDRHDGSQTPHGHAHPPWSLQASSTTMCHWRGPTERGCEEAHSSTPHRYLLCTSWISRQGQDRSRIQTRRLLCGRSFWLPDVRILRAFETALADTNVLQRFPADSTVDLHGTWWFGLMVWNLGIMGYFGFQPPNPNRKIIVGSRYIYI